MQRSIFFILSLATLVACIPMASAAAKKQRGVYLGAVRHLPYSRQGDPAGAAPGEDSLPIRALLVNGEVKEWTTGDPHDVTDRSFVVRRAIRLNNSLPGDTKQQWVWQRGTWLLVDRATGRISALKLPDYDPAVSRVVWFRDYAAYCGLTPGGKSLYAVVAQLTVRRPALAKKLAALDPASSVGPAGRDAMTYDFALGSAVLVEDEGEEPQTPDSTPVGAPQTQTQP
jgi:hypothetical protein